MLTSNAVVLILSTKDNRYNEFKMIQETTWVSELRKRGVRCYFYQGGSEREMVKDGTIYLTTKDEIRFCGQKLIDALKLLCKVEDDIQIIYRTNLSSYIEPDAFISYLECIDNPNNYYAGKVQVFNSIYESIHMVYLRLSKNIKNIFLSKSISFMLSRVRLLFIDKLKKYNYNFASGSGFFIGIDLVSKVVLSEHKKNYIDDVMVRFCLGKDPDNSIERFDFTEDYKSLTSEQYINMINRKNFHYRFKSSNRFFDTMLMRSIHEEKIRRRLIINE